MTNKPPAGITEADYDAIEAAVMETARGRWFLIEYERRRRAADNAQLLEAVMRLERVVTGQPALEPPARPAALPAPPASGVGERLQDIAWNMRERGFDEGVCAAIEEQARLVLGLANPTASPAALPAPAPDPRLAAFAAIDAMPLAEKLALFA